MGKENFNIDYSGSGVKSLRFLSWIFLIIFGGAGIIALLITASKFETLIFVFFIYSGLAIFSGIFFHIVLRAFATIAENALYQKTKLIHDLEKEYYIIEK